MDTRGHHFGVLSESADQVLRSANTREDDQDQVEGAAAKPVRRHQEVHRRIDHQEFFGGSCLGAREGLCEQAESDIDPGEHISLVNYNTIIIVFA